MKRFRPKWSTHLYLILVGIFLIGYGSQAADVYSEGFSLRGPTHCFSVGEGYDSQFLFSIRSLGYVGRIDFEVDAPRGITVELRTPIFLNSTGSGAYCPITVRAAPEAQQGNQSITVTAKGGPYSDSISICIIVSGFTTLTIQTSPSAVPLDFFLDDIKYSLGTQPLRLQIRMGKHTLKPITRSSHLGPTRLTAESLEYANSSGNVVRYTDLDEPLTLTITGESTVRVLFEETTPTLGVAPVLERLAIMMNPPVLLVLLAALTAFSFYLARSRLRQKARVSCPTLFLRDHLTGYYATLHYCLLVH